MSNRSHSTTRQPSGRLVAGSSPASSAQPRAAGGNTSPSVSGRPVPWSAPSRLLPLLLSALMSALLLASCAGEVPAVPSGDAQLVQGREVYARNCVGCHGVSGGGGTGSKLSDGVVVERFPDPAAQAEVVADGRNQMPAFVGKLTDDEIDAVVRFTREGL